MILHPDDACDQQEFPYGPIMSPTKIKLKRAYEAPTDDDGLRILVERLWPRGVSKVDAAIDHWAKDAAPTSQLRTWFGHRPERWAAFRGRYRAELTDNVATVDALRNLCAGLRTWFGHRPERWAAFRGRYRAELTDNVATVDALRNLCAGKRVTFVFAAKDVEKNSAVVLREFLLVECP